MNYWPHRSPATDDDIANWIRGLDQNRDDFDWQTLNCEGSTCHHAGSVADIIARVAADQLRIAELLTALEPFADISGEGDEDYPDDAKVVVALGRTAYYALRLGDLRRAAAAHREP